MSRSTVREKPGSFSGGELAEPVEAQPIGERRDVDEVPCLSAPEQGEHLVSGEFFESEHRSQRADLGGTDPGVDPEIQFGHLALAVGNREVSEAAVGPFEGHAEPVRAKCVLQDGDELVDSVGGRSEEVQVAGVAVHDLGDHQCGAAGESEALSLRESGHDPRDTFLQRAQHDTLMPRRSSQSAQALRT